MCVMLYKEERWLFLWGTGIKIALSGQAQARRVWEMGGLKGMFIAGVKGKNK